MTMLRNNPLKTGSYTDGQGIHFV